MVSDYCISPKINKRIFLSKVSASFFKLVINWSDFNGSNELNVIKRASSYSA
jgi:hypothetical protein